MAPTPCKCGAYGPGSQHTQACREGRQIERRLISVHEAQRLTSAARKQEGH